MQRQGIHTPADACDFARHCAALDFYALTDHAESLIPEHWEATKASVRECNARAEDSGPDLVAFTGFEWTHVDAAPSRHWGHRNVIFRGTGDEELPARPIGARVDGGIGPVSAAFRAAQARWIDPLHWREYAELEWLANRVLAMPPCPPGVATRELPRDCAENAATPAELYRKLDEWGLDALVIPHGNAWGLHAPTTVSWDGALAPEQHDPRREPLIEIMSGHGNSEEYRAWRPALPEARGGLPCPEPTREFLPCCFQAGEIMRRRCGDVSAGDGRTSFDDDCLAPVNERAWSSPIFVNHAASSVPDQ